MPHPLTQNRVKKLRAQGFSWRHVNRLKEQSPPPPRPVKLVAPAKTVPTMAALPVKKPPRQAYEPTAREILLGKIELAKSWTNATTAVAALEQQLRELDQ